MPLPDFRNKVVSEPEIPDFRKVQEGTSVPNFIWSRTTVPADATHRGVIQPKTTGALSSMENPILTQAGKLGEFVGVPQRAATTFVHNIGKPEEEKREFSASWSDPKGVYPSEIIIDAINPQTKSGRIGAAATGLAADIILDPINFFSLGAAGASRTVLKNMEVIDKIADVIRTDKLAMMVDEVTNTSKLDINYILGKAVKKSERKVAEKILANVSDVSHADPLRAARSSLENIHKLKDEISKLGTTSTKAKDADRTINELMQKPHLVKSSRTSNEYLEKTLIPRREAVTATLKKKDLISSIYKNENAIEVLTSRKRPVGMAASAVKKRTATEIARLTAENVELKKQLATLSTELGDGAINLPRKTHKLKQVANQLDAAIKNIEDGTPKTDLFDLAKTAETDKVLARLGTKTFGAQVDAGEIIPVALRLPLYGNTRIPIGGHKLQNSIFGAKEGKKILKDAKVQQAITNFHAANTARKVKVHVLKDTFDSQTAKAILEEYKSIKDIGSGVINNSTELDMNIIKHITSKIKNNELKRPKPGSELDYMFKVGSRGRADKFFLYKDNAGKSISVADVEKVQQASSTAVNSMIADLGRSLSKTDISKNKKLESELINLLETGEIAPFGKSEGHTAVNKLMGRLINIADQQGVANPGATVRMVPGELRHISETGGTIIERLRKSPLTAEEITHLDNSLQHFFGTGKKLSTADIASLGTLPRAEVLPKVLNRLNLNLTYHTKQRLISSPILGYNTSGNGLHPLIQHRVVNEYGRNRARAGGPNYANIGFFNDDYVPTTELNKQFVKVLGDQNAKPFKENIDATIGSIGYAIKEDINNRNTLEKVIQASMAKAANNAKSNISVTPIDNVADLKKATSIDSPHEAGAKITSGQTYLYDFYNKSLVEKLEVTDAIRMMESGQVLPHEKIIYIPAKDQFVVDNLVNRLNEVTGVTAFERWMNQYGTGPFKNWVASSPGFIIRNTIGDRELLEGLGVPTGLASGFRQRLTNSLIALNDGESRIIPGIASTKKGRSAIEIEKAVKYKNEAEALNLIESGQRGFSELQAGSGLVKDKTTKTKKLLDVVGVQLPRGLAKITDYGSNVFYGIMSKDPKDMSKVVRLAGYSYLRDKGYTPKSAGDMIRIGLVDYGSLTRTEQVVFKQAIPYYVWMTKGNLASLFNSLKNPHFLQRQRALQRAGENVFKGTDEEVERSRLGELTRGGEGLRMPLNTKDGRPNYMRMENWTPAGSLGGIANALFPDKTIDEKVYDSAEPTNISDRLRKMIDIVADPILNLSRFIAEGGNPVLKSVFESAMNVSISPWGTRELEAYKGQRTSKENKGLDNLVGPRVGNVLRGTMPPIGVGERVAKRLLPGNDPVTTEPLTPSIIRAFGSLTGFSTSTEALENDPKYKAGALKGYINDLKRDLRKAAKQGDVKTATYVRELIVSLQKTLDTMEAGD